MFKAVTIGELRELLTDIDDRYDDQLIRVYSSVGPNSGELSAVREVSLCVCESDYASLDFYPHP